MNQLEVSTQNGQPVKIGQQPCLILDRYRICPNWWEGYEARDYYLIDVAGKTICMYQLGEDWFLDSVMD